MDLGVSWRGGEGCFAGLDEEKEEDAAVKKSGIAAADVSRTILEDIKETSKELGNGTGQPAEHTSSPDQGKSNRLRLNLCLSMWDV